MFKDKPKDKYIEIMREVFTESQREVIFGVSKDMKAKLLRDTSGHDYQHVFQVFSEGIEIAVFERANPYVVALSALTHDIADYKLHGGDEEIGPRLAGHLLNSYSVDAKIINHVQKIIRTMNFRGPDSRKVMDTIEGMCVQDADLLDATGARGVARCFAFGGNHGNIIFDPRIKPNLNMGEEEYKKAKSTQINHIYEKLLLIKGRLNTKTARKKLNKSKRHKFMLMFLEQFYKEINATF